MKYVVVTYIDLGGNFTGNQATHHVQILSDIDETEAHEKAELFINHAKGMLGKRMCNIQILSGKNGDNVSMGWQ